MVDDGPLPTGVLADDPALARAIVDAVGEGLLVVAPDGTLLEVNRRFTEMTGFSRGELVGGLPPRPFWPPEHVDRLTRHIREVQAGTREGFECVLMTAEGRRFPIEVVGATLAGADGGVAAHLMTVRDVSWRRATERALRDTARQLAEALEAARDGHWEVDLEHETAAFSARAMRILGRPVAGATLPLDEVRALFDEDGLAVVQTAIDAPPGDAEDVHSVETRIDVPGADPRWVVFRGGVGERADDGSARRLVGTLTDVTDLHLAQERDRRTTERLEAVLEAVSEGVVMQRGSEGEITLCNRAACEILGLTREQMLGRDSYDPRWRAVREDGTPFRGDDHPAMRTLTTGRPARGVLMGIDSPAHGERRWISITTRPMGTIGEDGRPEAVVATFTDVTDAHRTTMEIRRERDFSSSVLRAVGEGMLILDAAGNLVAVNDAFRDMTGFGLRDLVSLRPPFPWWPPEEEAVIREALAHVMAGNAGTVDLTIMARDGRRIPVEARWSHVRDELGVVGAHIVTLRDLTARLRAESVVRRTEERFRTVLEAMAEGVLLVDPSGEVLMCNRAATQILGLSEDQIRLLPHDPEMVRVVDEDGRSLGFDAWPFADTLATGQAYTNVLIGVDREGRERLWLLVSSRAIGLLDRGDGRPEAAVLTFTDVGERHRAEEALRRSEERFRNLFESQGDAVAVLDGEGDILDASPSLLTLFGYTPETMPRNHGDGVHPEDRPLLADTHRRLMSGERGVVTVLRYLRGDGTWIWTEGVANPVHDPDGAVVGVQVSLRDVTERVLREQDERALHRIAELVAANAPAADIMAALAREVGAAVGADVAAVVRFDGDVGHPQGYWRRGELPDRLPPPNAVALADGDTTASLVWQTGEFAEIEGMRPGAGGAIGVGRVPTPDVGFAAPIRVGGALWGSLSAGLLHTTGVQGMRDRLTRFADLAALAVGAIAERARLEHDASVDPLTGLANRRVFVERLHSEIDRSRRYRRPLSLVMLDLDHFKRVNDTLGHAEGDRVLREVASRVDAVARVNDTVARLGGEELAWILPETGAEAAFQAAERLRASLSGAPHDDLAGITVSFGVAEFTAATDADHLYRRADAALYWAKEHGRDRGAVYSEALARELGDRESGGR